MLKRYFITSAVPGARVNAKLLNSIKGFCKKRDAELLIIPTAVILKNDEIDPRIPEKSIVLSDLQLNEKIRIDTIEINPQQVDPVTGLARNSQTDGSFIFASPKQRLKLVPNSNIKLPHALMTPGAITLPTNYKSNRSGKIALSDHVNGGLIVEVLGSTEYHFRQVQADKDGAFIDLGIQYNPDGTSHKVETEAVIGGDLHNGETDPNALRVLYELIDQFKPTYTVLHDVFNGHSVPHHDKHKIITRAQKSSENKISISDEIKELAKTLTIFSKKSKTVIIVRSNHDEWLDKYLEEVDYREDPLNHEISLELALAMIKGNNPLEFGIKKFSNLPNIRWLKRDEDLKITPLKIQVGSHGDEGNSGSRGSIQAIELAHAISVSGHSHTPEILRKTYRVGTTSILKPKYIKGGSSWLHTHCLVYKNGARQLINVINNKWKA